MKVVNYNFRISSPLSVESVKNKNTIIRYQMSDNVSFFFFLGHELEGFEFDDVREGLMYVTDIRWDCPFQELLQSELDLGKRVLGS